MATDGFAFELVQSKVEELVQLRTLYTPSIRYLADLWTSIKHRMSNNLKIAVPPCSEWHDWIRHVQPIRRPRVLGGKSIPYMVMQLLHAVSFPRCLPDTGRSVSLGFEGQPISNHRWSTPVTNFSSLIRHLRSCQLSPWKRSVTVSDGLDSSRVIEHRQLAYARNSDAQSPLSPEWSCSELHRRYLGCHLRNHPGSSSWCCSRRTITCIRQPAVRQP